MSFDPSSFFQIAQSIIKSDDVNILQTNIEAQQFQNSHLNINDLNNSQLQRSQQNAQDQIQNQYTLDTFQQSETNNQQYNNDQVDFTSLFQNASDLLQVNEDQNNFQNLFVSASTIQDQGTDYIQPYQNNNQLHNVLLNNKENNQSSQVPIENNMQNQQSNLELSNDNNSAIIDNKNYEQILDSRLKESNENTKLIPQSSMILSDQLNQKLSMFKQKQQISKQQIYNQYQQLVYQSQQDNIVMNSQQIECIDKQSINYIKYLLSVCQQNKLTVKKINENAQLCKLINFEDYSGLFYEASAQKQNFENFDLNNYIIELSSNNIEQFKQLQQQNETISLIKTKNEVDKNLLNNHIYGQSIQQDDNNYNLYAQSLNNSFFERNYVIIHQLIEMNQCSAASSNLINSTMKQGQSALYSQLDILQHIIFYNADQNSNYSKVVQFEKDNGYINLFYSNQFIFNCSNLVQINYLMNKDYITYKRIYLLIIKMGISDKLITYQRVCHLINVLLLQYFNEIYINQVNQQFFNPVSLINQLVDLIAYEYVKSNTTPIIRQFYNQNLLPSQNTYIFRIIAINQQEQQLIVTDGHYMLKIQTNQKIIRKMSLIYSLNNNIIISIPQFQGFNEAAECDTDIMKLVYDNYIKMQQSNYLFDKRDSNIKLGLYKNKLLLTNNAEESTSLQIGELIPHAMFQAIHILQQINNSGDEITQNNCGIVAKLITSNHFQNMQQFHLVVPSTNTLKQQIGEIRENEFFHLIGFKCYELSVKGYTQIRQYSCLIPFSNQLNLFKQIVKGNIQQILEMQSIINQQLIKQLELKLVRNQVEKYQQLVLCDNNSKVIYILKLQQDNNEQLVQFQENNTLQIQNIFVQKQQINDISISRIIYIRNMSNIIKINKQFPTNIQEIQILLEKLGIE